MNSALQGRSSTEPSWDGMAAGQPEHTLHTVGYPRPLCCAVLAVHCWACLPAACCWRNSFLKIKMINIPFPTPMLQGGAQKAVRGEGAGREAGSQEGEGGRLGPGGQWQRRHACPCARLMVAPPDFWCICSGWAYVWRLGMPAGDALFQSCWGALRHPCL